MGKHVWVLDEIQPVAVVLDATTGAYVSQVAWPEVPAGPFPTERRALSAAEGLWVQQPGGPVVLIGAEGLRSGHHVSDTTLGAVTAHGAWCAPSPPEQDIAATQDAPPRHPHHFSQLRVVRPGRVTQTVGIDAAVHSIRSVDEALFVEVETGAWSRRSWGSSRAWLLESETAWLRLGPEQSVPDMLSRDEHGHEAPPVAEDPDSWCGTPPDRGDALNWYVGRDESVSERADQLYAVAVEAGTRSERWRVRLGPTVAVGAVATSTHFWVALIPWHGSVDSGPVPRQLVRVDVATGKVEHLNGSFDITQGCWPLGSPPVDADDYVAFWRQHFSRLDAAWISEDGGVTPLSEGLSDTRVEVVGSWPDTTLHVTFAWTHRPGHRLRRVVALYDDLGRPEEPEYEDINLMEDLDVGNVATAPIEGSEFLDI